MQLLVSVSNAIEAAAAVAGGADLVDAKNPLAGPLGPVTEATFHAIVRTAAGMRPVTAALGDGTHPDALARMTTCFTRAGAHFVKVGFAGIADRQRVAELLTAAIEGARRGAVYAERPAGVIAVAYADAARAAALPVEDVLQAAIDARARGLLIDTFDKRGPGLTALLTGRMLESCVARAHRAGLLVALAGRLTSEDLPCVRGTGADIAGVRGAACGGKRTGRIDPGLVRALQSRCRRPTS